MKTKRLCVVDSGYSTCSIASEIISYITEKHFKVLISPPIRIAMPDCPEPTSFSLTKGFYVRAADIAVRILDALNIESDRVYNDLPEPELHDIPGEWFKGPF